ncbi:MAG: signal peptidase I [Microbacterium sp.]|uniref:signal peptidase I n=1 Tax=Microbacterium gubbeenense TaxID=159896 RepID=UPI003F9D0839
MTIPTTRRELRERAASDDVPAAASAAPGRRRARVGGVVGEVLLWLAAAAGLICIVLVILAYTANITLIMFRTGSMEPTIPAGSVAVVQQVDAAAVSVGDVVTVDRAGELPITHRVTSVAAGASADERVITMRGDANDVEDPAPYDVKTVRTVLFSVPGLAQVIVAMSNPLVLGGITIAATVLVVWAFWPRETKQEDAS